MDLGTFKKHISVINQKYKIRRNKLENDHSYEFSEYVTNNATKIFIPNITLLTCKQNNIDNRYLVKSINDSDIAYVDVLCYFYAGQYLTAENQHLCRSYIESILEYYGIIQDEHELIMAIQIIDNQKLDK